MSLRRRFLTGFAGALFLAACAPPPARAYSQFTHQQLIDLLWDASVRPLLLHRYPNATPAALERAHAYAYGGCLLQDIGYYPFGRKFFSDLTHYVRSGDFVRALLRDARDMDELAFAIGALSHYVGDSVGHSQAINPATALTFPELEAEYGPVVTYEDAPVDHIRTEFGFDVAQTAWNRYTPEAARKRTGFELAEGLLYRAFEETYGIPANLIPGRKNSAFLSYRWSAGFLIPAFLQAQIVLLRGRLPAEKPDAARTHFLNSIAPVTKAPRPQPGAGAAPHLLALLIRVLPKIGRLKILDIQPPATATEDLFLDSANHARQRFAESLAQVSREPGATPLANLDLDTGHPVRRGKSELVDQTHAKLLRQLKQSSRPLPPELREYLSRYAAGAGRPGGG